MSALSYADAGLLPISVPRRDLTDATGRAPLVDEPPPLDWPLEEYGSDPEDGPFTL